jgi:hypothetical protein
MPDRDRSAFASASLPRHLTRGALGFGLIGCALALTPSVGPAALLLTPAGLVTLRGCPMCWTAGLIQTISAGRLKRACSDAGCALQSGSTPTVTPDSARVPELPTDTDSIPAQVTQTLHPSQPR